MINAAVICELNPAHNGHKYIFDEIRRRSGSDRLIALMSGNYVQRGEPALVDKYTRARMALLMGADLVLELPSPFSHQSAREFAMAGVALAGATGIVDVLGFGAELSPGDIQAFEGSLKMAADILLDEPEAYRSALRKALKEGLSYPRASELGLRACGIEEAELISSPNNILAREYLRAIRLHDQEAPLQPLIIPRLGDGYNVEQPEHECFASATALRRLLLNGASIDTIRQYVPFELWPLYQDLCEGRIRLIYPDDLSTILDYVLLGIKGGLLSYGRPFDVPEDLYARIMNSAEELYSYSERISRIKTKSYTYTRISRALLNMLLQVTEKEAEEKKAAGYADYIRILGFRRDSQDILSELKASASVPVISRAAGSRELLGSSIYHDNIYYSLTSGTKNEYERQIGII